MTNPPLKKQNLAKSLTCRYLFALTLIAALISTSYYVLTLLINEQQSTAAVINISGRQRMLSQRITMISHIMAETAAGEKRTAYQQELGSLIRLMADSHQALSRGSAELNIPGEKSEIISSLYFSPPENVDRQVSDFLAHAENLYVMDSFSQNNSHLSALVEAGMGRLLTSLDNIVFQYQIEGEQKVAFISRIELFVWLAALLLLSLEALLIFRPMIRYVTALLANSEQARAELDKQFKELKTTRCELLNSEKSAAVGRMVAGFAHEINTPLGILLTAISTLQESALALEHDLTQQKVSKQDVVEKINTICLSARLALSNAQKAVNLISGLKHTSVDMQSDAARDFNLNALFLDISFALSHKLKSAKAEISIDCPADLILTGKPGILDQLFSNLIVNSIVHGFKEDAKPHRIKICASLIENNALLLHYCDNGRGIKAEILPQIYDLFYTTASGEGSGLGMFICYNLITTELQGSIECRSNIGEGVSFKITAPLKAENARLILGK